MSDLRRDQLPGVALFALSLCHALVTWPTRPAVALFVGGVAIAFPLEVVGVRAGLLCHRFRPQVAGVPVTILLAWPAAVYLPYRVALAVVPSPVPAALLGAALATVGDALLEPAMVRRGAWSYPDAAVSRPRFYGIPWWNFAVWPCVAFATARLPAVVAG